MQYTDYKNTHTVQCRSRITHKRTNNTYWKTSKTEQKRTQRTDINKQEHDSTTYNTKPKHTVVYIYTVLSIKLKRTHSTYCQTSKKNIENRF